MYVAYVLWSIEQKNICLQVLISHDARRRFSKLVL